MLGGVVALVVCGSLRIASTLVNINGGIHVVHPADRQGLRERCAAFLTELEGATPEASFQDDGQVLGTAGGEWSPCTHLRIYGLNFAPFFGRFLAYQLAPRTVLEFGCGLGATSDFIAQSVGASVTCIEPERTLATLIGTLRRDNVGNGHLTQLAVNIFDADDETKACVASIPRHDLVLSLEVAEHIPLRFHPALMDFLARSTAKWLVFSAARPGQGGTGHLNESMFSRDEWVAKFEQAGLVYMPNLTWLARRTTYPLRGYDLFANVIVMRHPSNAAEDAQEVHEMLAHFMFGGLDWDRAAKAYPSHTERAKVAAAFAQGSEAAMWPTMSLMEQKAKKHLICGPRPVAAAQEARSLRIRASHDNDHAASFAPALAAGSSQVARGGAPLPASAVLEDLGEKCVSFLVDLSHAEFHDDEEFLSSQGAEWSPCTLLRARGLNFAPFFARFLAYQLAPETVLEFGCGLGTTSDFVARAAGASVTCIEPERTLTALAATMRKDGIGSGHLRQLAINVFDGQAPTRACVGSLPKHDLVLSLEVAEHIPAELHPQLVSLLVRSTRKWLVFSAARPEQVGAGHLLESLRTPEEWVRKFQKAGLVYMPELTAMARQTTYPERGGDLYHNTIVLKHPDNRAADAQPPHEMLEHFMFGGLDRARTLNEFANDTLRDQVAQAFSEGAAAALWPTLTLVEQKARKGLLCREAAPQRSPPPQQLPKATSLR